MVIFFMSVLSPSLSLLFSTVRCLVLILSLVLLCWYSLSFSQLWHGSDPILEIASMWAEPFSFVLIKWHSCWPRKWKGSFTQNFHFSFGVTFFCQISIRGSFGDRHYFVTFDRFREGNIKLQTKKSENQKLLVKWNLERCKSILTIVKPGNSWSVRHHRITRSQFRTYRDTIFASMRHFEGSNRLW